MNLVLCDPEINLNKSNSYDYNFIAKHQEVIIKHYSSRIVALLSVGRKPFVTSKDIPALLNSKTIHKIEDMFGKDITRKYYAEVLGIDWQDLEKNLLPYNEHIKEFIAAHIQKNKNSITENEEIFKRYEQFCKMHELKSQSYNIFIKNFAKEIELKSFQKRINGSRPKVFAVSIL